MSHRASWPAVITDRQSVRREVFAAKCSPRQILPLGLAAAAAAAPSARQQAHPPQAHPPLHCCFLLPAGQVQQLALHSQCSSPPAVGSQPQLAVITVCHPPWLLLIRDGKVCLCTFGLLLAPLLPERLKQPARQQQVILARHRRCTTCSPQLSIFCLPMARARLARAAVQAESDHPAAVALRAWSASLGDKVEASTAVRLAIGQPGGGGGSFLADQKSPASQCAVAMTLRPPPFLGSIAATTPQNSLEGVLVVPRLELPAWPAGATAASRASLARLEPPEDEDAADRCCRCGAGHGTVPVQPSVCSRPFEAELHRVCAAASRCRRFERCARQVGEGYFQLQE